MISSLEELRTIYPEPKERALKKQLSMLDAHCRRFISLSPFVVVATGGNDGMLDASPRGGDPGFVHVVDDRTLLIPDSPGNNRLDSLSNIIATGRIGLLFLIPGVDETLRVNGSAAVSDDPEKLSALASDKRTPRSVIEVNVEEAFLHCAKAFMRAKLWDPQTRRDRGVLPTMGEMIKEQAGLAGPAETQEEMLARFQPDL